MSLRAYVCNGWKADAIFAIAEKADPVARVRLAQNVRWTLSKQLDRVRQTEHEQAEKAVVENFADDNADDGTQ